jgi:hypothetical protein
MWTRTPGSLPKQHGHTLVGTVLDVHDTRCCSRKLEAISLENIRAQCQETWDPNCHLTLLKWFL